MPSTVHSEGRLSVTDPGQAATMVVHWDTGVLGDGLMFSDKDYVVLDTDYTSRALVCSCQHLNLGFFAVNRRSCDYMIVSTDCDTGLPRGMFCSLCSIIGNSDRV